MAGVLLDMAISLDGFVGGPDGADVGLYDWYFEPSAASAPIVEELVRTTGAIVIGRGAYGTGESEGWDDTPYHVKHFVLTHRPPAAPVGGAVDFTFVTDGVSHAVELARAAAGENWVTVGGERTSHASCSRWAWSMSCNSTWFRCWSGMACGCSSRGNPATPAPLCGWWTHRT